MYILSRRIKSLGIKVVLSGEGADEAFGGYLYFHKAPSPEVRVHYTTMVSLCSQKQESDASDVGFYSLVFMPKCILDFHFVFSACILCDLIYMRIWPHKLEVTTFVLFPGVNIYVLTGVSQRMCEKSHKTPRLGRFACQQSYFCVWP